MRVIKKDGTLEDFDGQKIVNAVSKSAARMMIKLTDTDYHNIVSGVLAVIEEKHLEDIPIYEMHNIVEKVLEDFNPVIAKSYKDYRNYKKDFVHMMDKVWWWQMIQLLPTSYNQKRTVQLNYAVLKNIYHSRRNHKLDEWCMFCSWIETLPYSELITG